MKEEEPRPLTEEQQEALDKLRNPKFVPKISHYGRGIRKNIEVGGNCADLTGNPFDFTDFEDSRHCVHLGS